MRTVIVGVDCATESAKVGVALGTWEDGSVSVTAAKTCGRVPPRDVICEWLDIVDDRVLLAIDAPLGWPAELGDTLVGHSAGEEIRVPKNEIFRRATDRFIQKTIHKTPLDVGADRIARTAHAALRLLGDLRRALQSPLPLAWSPQELAHVSAIEVYPAATLATHRIRSTAYKKPTSVEERRQIINALTASLQLEVDVNKLEASDDAIDAVVCVLAAKDFLENRSIHPSDATPPVEIGQAKREGWIWCAPRQQET